MNQNSLSHRDIKPENFIFKTQDEDTEIKLIDFGLSKKFGDKEGVLETMVGTPYYVAPEVLSGAYGPECDTWSLGVVLYAMLSGNLPFGGENNAEILRRIKIGKF